MPKTNTLPSHFRSCAIKKAPSHNQSNAITRSSYKSHITKQAVRVAFAYLFGIVLGWGVIGVWLAHSVLDWIVRSVIFYLRYRSNKWETKAIKL